MEKLKSATEWEFHKGTDRFLEHVIAEINEVLNGSDDHCNSNPAKVMDSIDAEKTITRAISNSNGVIADDGINSLEFVSSCWG